MLYSRRSAWHLAAKEPNNTNLFLKLDELLEPTDETRAVDGKIYASRGGYTGT